MAEGPSGHHDVVGNDAVGSEPAHVLTIDGLKPVEPAEGRTGRENRSAYAAR